MKYDIKSLSAMALAVLVAACGGGGDPTSSTGIPPTTDPMGPGNVAGPTAPLPALTLADGVHAPAFARDGTIHVGGNAAPAATALAAAATHGETRVSAGTVHDTTPGGDIAALLRSAEMERPAPYTTMQRSEHPQVVKLAPNSGPLEHYVTRAVQIINTALPPGERLILSTDPALPYGHVDALRDGEIGIAFGTLLPGTAAIAESGATDGRRTWSYIRFNRDDTYARIANATTPAARELAKDQFMTDVVHELIHSMGLDGHPDPTLFAESVMSYSFQVNPGHVLFPLDRDLLTASYTVIRPAGTDAEMLTDLGAWAGTSMHVRGELETTDGALAFGVAARQGVLQPWFTGLAPATDLGVNPSLAGTATWQGRLLGLTPATNAVAGGAALEIDLGTLNGTLAFRELEYWSSPTPRNVGTGNPWGDGALSYTVEVRGNTFVQTGGDDGVVTGVFAGRRHEGMGGVLERTDLTAAFAGTR